MSNFDGVNQVRVHITVADKIIDSETGNKRIKADIPNGDGHFPHNVNVKDDPFWQVLTKNNAYDVTISRGNGMPNGKNNTLSYGYFWNLLEIHADLGKTENSPPANQTMVDSAVAMGATVISQTPAPVVTPEPYKDWRERAEERKQQSIERQQERTQLSIERQQLITIANQMYSGYEDRQIKIGNSEILPKTMKETFDRIIQVAELLEPYFHTGFQKQVVNNKNSIFTNEETLPYDNEQPAPSGEALRALLDQPSRFDLNDMEQR